jgi:hypothetical protein
MIKSQTSIPAEAEAYPLKVCVVSENDTCARSAVRMIQRVSKTTDFRLTLLHLDEFASPSNGGSLAHAPLDSELFIVAMSHGGELPGVSKKWIERWAYMRGEGHDCALVAFITNGSPSLDSRSPLVEYLAAIAAARGLAFFYGKSQGLVNSDSPQPQDRAAHSTFMLQTMANHNQVAQRWGINE